VSGKGSAVHSWHARSVMTYHRRIDLLEPEPTEEAEALFGRRQPSCRFKMPQMLQQFH